MKSNQGIAGVVWSVGFLIVITDSPKNHKFIKAEEKDYLIYETRNQVAAKERGPIVFLHFKMTSFNIQLNFNIKRKHLGKKYLLQKCVGLLS
jgi:hypothetical protein